MGNKSSKEPEVAKKSSDCCRYFTNPGTFDDLHKMSKDVFPKIFDGAKFEVLKGINNHFQITHTVVASSVLSSGYRFGATYVGTDEYGNDVSYPILYGDIDALGRLNCKMRHRFGESLTGRFAASVETGRFLSESMFDYEGSTWTATMKLINPDFLAYTGVLEAQYLHNVHENIDVGVSLHYLRSPHFLGGQDAFNSFAARYTACEYIFSGLISCRELELNYYQYASKQLQLAVEFKADFIKNEAVTTFGYQVDLDESDLVFKGMVDTNLNVGVTLDKKLQPLPFTVMISALLNHYSDKFCLGLGFVVG